MSISHTSVHTLSLHFAGIGDVRNDFRNYNLMQLIVSLVRGQSVLDIGCGNGFLLDILRKRGKKILGIEPLSEMIALANQHFPGLPIYKGLAEDLDKILPNRVDTIILTDVLEHIKDDQTQLKKIHDRLNPRGQLILVVPAYPFLYGKKDRNLGHFRRYSKSGLMKLCSETSFTITSIRYWNLLGVIPYFISEKILGKELNTSLRASSGNSKSLKKYLNHFLHRWFSLVENNFNAGFGLSIICVAERI